MAAEKKTRSFVSTLLPYTTVVLLIVAIYVGWTFYSRWRDAKSAREAAAAEKAAHNKQVVDQIFGSGQVKLLNFSISQIHLRKGDTTQMCYGVSNAVSVVIEPHVEDTKPSYNHCFEIAPKQSTTYTLTAKDKAGHVVKGSLPVVVK
jgi:hypothetical protein